jgi:hypothetical protein
MRRRRRKRRRRRGRRRRFNVRRVHVINNPPPRWEGGCPLGIRESSRV